jgi:uncharacterized protein (DUF952 family)
MNWVAEEMPRRIYHLALTSDWAPGYRPGSLEREGFVHCSIREELGPTLEQHFASDSDLVLVEIDPELLDAELRWEVVPGRSTPMPHLYGTINNSAVVTTHSLSHDGTHWLLPWDDQEPTPPASDMLP